MTFDEIFEEWKKDSVIDPSNLAMESLNTHVLHGKYYKYYIDEKKLYNKAQAEYDRLKVQKFEFYRYGETAETREKGWKLPEGGARMTDKTVEPYLATDPDLVKLTLAISNSREKLHLLKDITKTVLQRSFLIKNALEFMKWQQGQ